MKIKKKYCEKCGAKLAKSLLSTNKFSPENGERLFKVLFTCPRYKEHWFFGSEHSKFVVGEIWYDGEGIRREPLDFTAAEAEGL